MVIKLNLQKIRADDLILISIFCMFVVLLLFFKLIALMSIYVFPMSSLLFYSSYIFGKGLFSKNLGFILLGILGIPISLFFLWIFFIHPSVTIEHVIYFLGMPIMIIGFAAIIKGTLIEAYSIKFRIINIILGNITVIITIFTFIFAEDLFLFNIVGFSILLFLNAIFRVAMYLSEYRLSLKNLKSRIIIRFLIEIMTELPVLEVEDDSLEYIDV